MEKKLSYAIFKINKTKLKLIILLGLILSFAFLIKVSNWWSMTNNKLTLKEISISDTKIIKNTEYHELTSGFLGLPLNIINIDSVTKIISNHPYVEAVRVSKWYPSRMKIEIIEREPIAILNVRTNDSP